MSKNPDCLPFAIRSRLADNAGIPAATAAQRLLIAAKASTPDSEAKGQAQGPAATTAATEVPAESPSSKAAGSSNASSRSHAAEASRVEKLQRLFRLWDRAGDGSISFDELCQGLGKFKPVTCKKVCWLLSVLSGVVVTRSVWCTLARQGNKASSSVVHTGVQPAVYCAIKQVAMDSGIRSLPHLGQTRKSLPYVC